VGFIRPSASGLIFRYRPIASLLEAPYYRSTASLLETLRYRAFGIRLKKLEENENRDLIRENQTSGFLIIW